ncbi:unnamed protein product [Auanema sp. JU1783]|nr:unnamed protein product [Auanema sp. JU1783]
MIERRRLPSATYHSADEAWSRDFFAEQPICVHPKQHDAAHVARKVASQQITGAPFFVMDVPSVLRSVDDWMATLPRFSPHYALRCNADPVLAQLLADQRDMGFEVTNVYELQLALELVNPSRIVFTNPLWTRKTMRIAGEANVGTVVISREKELLDAVSYTPDSNILIAVSLGCPIRGESVATTSGCSSDEAEQLIISAFELKAKVRGFSFNIDNSDPSIYYKALKEVRRLFDYAVSCGLSPNTVSVGGGFRCPRGDDKLRFFEVCDSLSGAVEEMFPSELFPSLRLIASPGRFFATSAFSLCTNVVAKKPVDINMPELKNNDSVNSVAFVYQTNDGIYGSFSCRLADCDPKCRPLNEKENDGSYHLGTVIGPSLETIDIAQRWFCGRQLSVGEWLLWENMGAYSMPLDPDYQAPPVYYYSGKDNWDYILGKGRSKQSASFMNESDNNSDFASDVESISSDEEYDLITRFDSFFD